MKYKLIVQDLEIDIRSIDKTDYTSLTDIARNKNLDESKDVVKKIG